MQDHERSSAKQKRRELYSLAHGLPQPDGVWDGADAAASTSHNGHPGLLVSAPVHLTAPAVAIVQVL